MGAGTQDWLDRELAGSSFVDERLGKRLRKLVELMGDAIGIEHRSSCLPGLGEYEGGLPVFLE